jgi:alkylresorcinol/alkylpyrone synthase
VAKSLSLSPRARRLMCQFHANSGVRSRHFALTLDEYPKLSGFGRANDAYLEAALDLGGQAVVAGLREAG